MHPSTHQCSRWYCWCTPAPTNVVDGTVGAPQQKKGSCRVEGGDGQDVLSLPVTGHGVPDTDLADARQPHQLVADEEQVLYAHAKVERSCIGDTGRVVWWCGVVWWSGVVWWNGVIVTPSTDTSNQYQQLVPSTSTSNQQLVPATCTSNQYN